MIRLIISDIDGTLAPEGSGSINPEYMEVIRALTDRGVQFAAASGRQSSSVDAVFHEVRDRIYYLTDNGACIHRYGELEKAVHLCREDMKELLDEIRKIPDCYVLLSATDGYYTDERDEDFYRLVFEEYRGKGSVVDNLDDYLDLGVKLSLFCKNGSREVLKQIDERWMKKFAINISGALWLDVNDFASTKGNAVRYIQEELGVTPAETVVFGDNFNDVSMFERAERSYVSVLSHPDVKKAARYEVASYEEDGVLKVLKQMLEEIDHEG